MQPHSEHRWGIFAAAMREILEEQGSAIQQSCLDGTSEQDRAALIEKLEVLSVPEPNTGCRLWFGPADGRGYGRLTVGGRTRGAHRVACEL